MVHLLVGVSWLKTICQQIWWLDNRVKRIIVVFFLLSSIFSSKKKTVCLKVADCMYICTLHLTRNEILALTFAHNWIQRREEYKLFDHYTSISQYCQKKELPTIMFLFVRTYKSLVFTVWLMKINLFQLFTWKSNFPSSIDKHIWFNSHRTICFIFKSLND